MKNTEMTDKKSRVLNAVGGINDEFILDAAPTGRHERRSYRGLIAAAIGTAAAAAVVLIAVFGGKGKPNAPIQQAKATNEPIVTNAPEATTEPEEIAIPTPQIKGMTARLRRTSSASSAQEWKEVHPEPGMDADGRTWSYEYGTELDPDYEFPTPAEVLTQTENAVFRGRVLKIENYTLNLKSDRRDYDLKHYFAVVTFLVEDCYRGGLEIGSEIRLFFLGGITPNETVLNEFDGHGAGMLIWTQLRPEAEVIAVVHMQAGDKGFVFYIGDPEVLPEDEVEKYKLSYEGLADHTYLPLCGTMFLQADGSFLYDHDVYTPDMLGENPSLDSAESYIRSLLSGLEL